MKSAFSDAAVRRLAAGWLLLALVALAFSTLCAILLVAARTPWSGMVAPSGELFGRALVLHVSLAVIVWFLSFAAGIWTLAAGGVAGSWRWAALTLACVGLGGMVAALFFGAATPVLANYIPVLDSPLFLAGLGLFFCGVTLCGISSGALLIRQWRTGPVEIWRLGAALSIGAAAIAVAGLAASLQLGGLPQDSAGFEVLAWGPGHILQFVHVILLMSVWMVLFDAALGKHRSAKTMAPRRWLSGLLWLAALPVLAAPVIYLSYPIASPDFRSAFTLLMALGLWPAPVLLALRLLLLLRRAGSAVWKAPQIGALLLSILLFLLGCMLGALIRNDSTMVPAHYHGTVGAVTLAYMALGYQLVPAFGGRLGSGALVRWQPLLYGSGLMILALALAWSGWLGVPRKTMHVDVMVQYPAYFAAMGLAGLGGLLAISGAALFVMNIVRSFFSGSRPTLPRPHRRDVRWPALALTLAMTAAFGMLLAYLPNDMGAVIGTRSELRQDVKNQVPQKYKEAVDRHFSESVALLNAKQYDAAARELARVIELAPQMPEAYVNMGFITIGTQRYAMAQDFFNAAINLNASQHNAYFGLAVALEGLHDLPGALGAMRTYVHLSKPDDAYLRKANAAIWEWEATLKQSQTDQAGTGQGSGSPGR